ncbi:MAG: DUF4292 domain-containing protein [Bacteroidota bacterium]|nr:DUF4292 domain-containing protein [Bacteroidota bacterium]MCA6442392.1 DUF4292 domain-containing protein [Bacteroidota bacterium]
MTKIKYIALLVSILLGSFVVGCKSNKKTKKTTENVVQPTDTLNNKCKLDFKNGRALTKYMLENEFKFDWLYLKANVESNVDNDENNFDVKARIKRDSVIYIVVEKLGLDVAKILITQDSVRMRFDLKRQYFKGDFKYINDLLNADLDFEVLQSVLVGNSAKFYDEDEKLNPVTDRTNCNYKLSTERKKRLRRIQNNAEPAVKALQIITLNPDNFKITKNEFIDPLTNRIFAANYQDFNNKDSIYAPRLVNIDILAEKKAKLKIEYVRIEKNVPQKVTLNIPKSYDPIEIKKK